MVALMMAALLALSPVEGLMQEAAPTDKEGEAAAHKLREDAAKGSIDAKIAAMQEAIKTEHEAVIKVIGQMMLTEADPVRIAGAAALGQADHPGSAEALVAAIGPNLRREEVMAAICKAIGELGWQSAAKPLNDLLSKVAEAEVRQVLPEAIKALGQLGSLSSVDPLIELLMKLENGARRNPWPNEGPMRRSAEEALRSITGAANRNVLEWETWWKSNKDSLPPKMIRVYWLKKTQERIDIAPGEKVPADAVLAATRLHSAPPAGAPTAKKKKKPK